MRGLLSVTLSQQLRRQAAELMGKYGITVPKGVAITSLDGVQKAIKDTFAGQDEGAEFMGKYGINVPNGVAITSLDEVQKAIKDTFAGQDLVPIDALKAAAMEQMKSDQVADIAEKMVTKQTGPKGKGIGPQVKQTGPRKPPLVSRWLDEGTEDIAIIAPDAFSVEGIEVGVLRTPEWVRSPTIELVRPLLPNTRVVVHSDASLERTSNGFLCCMAHVGRDMDTGELIWYATGVCDAFSPDSNPAELSGMLYACYMAKCLGIEHLLIKCDNIHAVEMIDRLLSKVENCEMMPMYLSFQKLKEGGMKIDAKHITDKEEKKVADKISRAERSEGKHREVCIREFLELVKEDIKCGRKFD